MVPNLLTVGNMALGFFAIMASFNERWIAAPTAIFIAHILDILDGRMARWMGTASEFGGEMDSFADWISFSIAPAFMVYFLALHEYGKLGFLLAFFLVLAGALRLARFNIMSKGERGSDSLNFLGLPAPCAGGFIAILVLLIGLSQNGIKGKTLTLLYHQIPLLREGIPVIVFLISLLMISKIQFSTFKNIKVFRPQSLRVFLVTLFVCFMIYAYPQNTIFFLYSGYILWGVLNTTWRSYRLRGRA